MRAKIEDRYTYEQETFLAMCTLLDPRHKQKVSFTYAYVNIRLKATRLQTKKDIILTTQSQAFQDVSTFNTHITRPSATTPSTIFNTPVSAHTPSGTTPPIRPSPASTAADISLLDLCR